MVQDLRHREELADRGRVLDRQRGEIGAQRLHLASSSRIRTSAAWLARSSLVRINPAADGVLQLELFTRKWIQPMPRPSARMAAAL
jgi:hypothetical protein